MATKKGRATRESAASGRERSLPRTQRPRRATGADVRSALSNRSAAQSRAVARSRPHLITLFVLTLCALGLYLWRLDQPKRYVYDEVYHAYTAAQLAAGNADAYVWYTHVPATDKGVAYEWTHPAFAKLAMQAGILLFGDNSFGWRIASAVFGAAGVGMLYALGCLLFDQTVGLLAAGLLLFDGMWFVQSRTAMNDVFVVFFILLAYYAFAFYLGSSDSKRWLPLWLTGIALGFGIAAKWSALYSFGMMGAIAAVRETALYFGRKGASPGPSLLVLMGSFVVLPLAIYVGSYVQFFAMGHTLAEWRELQRQMWEYHTNLKATHTWQSSAWSWPLMITPVWYYVDYQKDTVANIWAIGNPLIWWAFLPAIVVAALRWRDGRYRSVGLGLVLLGFVGQWLPWFFSPRISFLYHMLPSMPFGCLAIAYTLGQLSKQRRLVASYLAAVLIAFIFFFPQYSAWPVSPAYAKQHYWLSSWQPR